VKVDPRTVRRPARNRRAFLRGAAGITLGLPFLEGLPERSAWAAGQEPVFSLFIGAACGVVGPSFFPDSTGPLTVAGLTAAGKATSELARHADNLLFVTGVNWPGLTPRSCSHAQGSCMELTARPSTGSGSQATATGPSADVVIADKVQPGIDPLTLYAGNLHNGYIAERLSFTTTGQVRSAADNPYTLYQQLVGLAAPDGTMTTEGQQMAQLLLKSRKSVNDVVRIELQELLANSRLSAKDKQRLQQHFDGIRDAEITMGDMGDQAAECTLAGLDRAKLDALESGIAFKPTGMIEDIGQLHMSLVALAFACNYNRTATLQWGDGTDHTVYDVPSNQTLGGWNFHYISHRLQSDGAVGDNPTAEAAHAEIDALRMRSIAAGLDHFAARGLERNAFVLWTNHIADGPSHSYLSVPHVIWGSGGGFLKQAEYVDAGGVTNNRLLSALVSAAVQDTGTAVNNFGDGDAGGALPIVLA
jgi:hypothetical protein